MDCTSMTPEQLQAEAARLQRVSTDAVSTSRMLVQLAQLRDQEKRLMETLHGSMLAIPAASPEAASAGASAQSRVAQDEKVAAALLALAGPFASDQAMP